MNKVSVIIPVYNAGQYLNKCLDSILNQTYKNIELIVINDGSIDNSLDILNQYSKKYKNIRIINKENAGVSEARNDGIKNSNGEYLMFVDADDWIDIDMIEKMMDFVHINKADIVKCGYVRDSITKQEFFPIAPKMNVYSYDNKQLLYDEFIKNYNYNSSCTQIFNKKLLKNNILFNSKIKIGEDLLFNMELYTNAEIIVSLPECYYHYFYNDNSATTKKKLSSIITRCEDAIEVYYHYFNYYKKWNLPDKYYEKICYRVIKELNVKLITLYRLNDISKKERKKIVHNYINNEKIRNCSKKLNFFNIMKHLNVNDLFIYFIVRKNYFMYNLISTIACIIKNK